ncbi:MAG: hypothetical protein IPM82_32340 [Saprospiraceae bacterium]|nr:hypothetical protein [Saprospiraceae bacterium]
MRLSAKWQGSKESLSKEAALIFFGGIEAALEMRLLTGEEKYAVQAFAFAERSKAFSLLENLKNAQAKSFAGISRELVEKEDSIHQDIAFYDGLILEEEQNGRNSDSTKLYYWHNERLELKQAQDSLTAVLGKKYPDYYRLKYDLKTSSPKDVQKSLPQNTTLLEYFLTDTLLYTFAIDKKQVRFFRKTDKYLL